MNLTLIAATISAAVGFGTAWQLQAHQIVKLKLEQANARISQQRTARATIERTTTQLLLAQNNAAGRVATLRRDNDSLRNQYAGLQSQSADSLRAASSSLDACITTAATFSELLGICSDRYSGLAAKAQGHVSDLTTLIQSWPSAPK